MPRQQPRKALCYMDLTYAQREKMKPNVDVQQVLKCLDSQLREELFLAGSCLDVIESFKALTLYSYR